MNEELFTVPEQLSPRLKWMIYYGVKTYEHEHAGSESPETGDEIPRWSAWAGNDPMKSAHVGGGETEHDAIVALALKMKLKPWNEQ